MHRRNEAGSLYKEWNALMEFELEKNQLSGYDAVLDTTLLQEETLEMIVPDACPDILRVVDTGGKALVRAREAGDGRAEVTGSIQAQVIYLPDGESGVRSLSVTIPYTCAVERGEIGPDCLVVASARLCRADTRVINPRKVLVRAEAAVDVIVFAAEKQSVCCRVRCEEDSGVEQLSEDREMYLTACVEEKAFSLSEEIPLSASKPAAAGLLESRAEMRVIDSKLIGSKLIFKGSVNVSLLCCGEDGSVYTAGGELPFSQIMEVNGVGEGADCDITLALTGWNCTLDGGEGRSVSVELDVLAQAQVRETRSSQVLVDAYCVHAPVVAQWENYTLTELLDAGVRTQNAREAWETAPPARDVADCRLRIREVTRSREGEKLVLTAQTELTVLYMGDDGQLCASARQVSVPCVLEQPEECRCFCRCEAVGDVYATPAAGGLEVRFALDFRYWAVRRRECAALSALEPGEEEPAQERPSLVLRRMEAGERLWDVAKAYATTIADIMSANELPDEPAAAGRLLLIPRKR